MARKDKYYIEVVGKALDVLEAFSQLAKRQLTLREVSDHVRLSRNVVFRILYTLGEHRYTLKSNKKYELGPKLLDLSNTKLRHTDLLTVSGPVLEHLRDECGETVNLGILVDHEIRYVGVWESRHAFRLAEHVGARDFLHCSSLGKAHLAYLPLGEVRELLRKAGMPVQTKRTITSLRALKTELAATRERGYALDVEESSLGACCLGVPILGLHGSPLAAISVSGPMSRFTGETISRLARRLLAVAAEIRLKLGSVPTPARKRTMAGKPAASPSALEGAA